MTRLETERLILRPFAIDDIAAYTAIRAQKAVARFLPGGEADAANARASAERIVPSFKTAWENPPHYGPWAVIDKASGALIGHHGLRYLAEHGGETEILYALDPAFWGRGYATEAGIAARDFGFQQLGLPRLIALALPQNVASLRVMDKIGLTREPGLVQAFGLEVVRATIERPGGAAKPA